VADKLKTMRDTDIWSFTEHANKRKSLCKDDSKES